MVLAGGPGLSMAEARAAVAARCWAGTAAAVPPELGWPRKEAGEGKRRKRAGRLGEKKNGAGPKVKKGRGVKGNSLCFSK